MRPGNFSALAHPQPRAVTRRRKEGWSRANALTRSPEAQLVLACGIIGAVFLGVLVVPDPIWAGQPMGPPAPNLPALEPPVGWPGVPIAILFVLTLCLPFRPYVLAARSVAGVGVSVRLLFGLTASLAAIGLFIFPRFGTDLFDYVGFERMWVVYGDNPLVALVINHPSDWAASLVWYPGRTPAYGPLWALLTWPLVRVAGESVLNELIAYKLLALAGYAGCCWLIWHIVEPERRQRGFVMFAWSPLVLFEVLGKVHNDILPALSMLSMVWLVRRSRAGAGPGLVACVAGGLVKASALAAAPPVLLHLWSRGGWRSLAPAAFSAAVLVVVCYAPFWTGIRTLLPLLQQTSVVEWSPNALLTAMSGLLPGGPFPVGVRIALSGCWLGGCVLVLVRVRHKLARAEDLALSSGWLLLLTLLLLTGAVFAHYFVPVVALAAVAGDRRFEQTVMWLSLGGLAAYSVDLFGAVLVPGWLGSTGDHVAGSMVLLGPALVWLLIRCWSGLTELPAAEV